MRGPVAKLLAYAETLRFPWLLLAAAGLFLVDLAVPDAIPFVDEILLGLATVLLSRMKRKKKPQPGKNSPPV